MAPSLCIAAPQRMAAPLRLAGCLLLAAMLAVAAGLADLPTARAATSLPPEPGALRLDGTAADAAVADLDGDGVREVVRIVPWVNDPTLLAVEVVHQAAGGWELAGEALLERPEPEGQDAGALGPARVGDAVRLVAWHGRGRERLFVVVNAGPSILRDAPCCLIGWEVAGLDAFRPTLREAFTSSRGGDAVVALDMDGDGTDELVVHQPASPDAVASLAVLRWNGTSFRQLTLSPLMAGDPTRMSVLGDSDGLPGEEVAFVGNFGATAASPANGLTRISLRGGQLHAETAELPASGRPLAVRDGTGPEPLIVIGDLDTPLAAFRWPSDGPLQQVETSTRPGRPVAVVGSGANARLAVDRGLPAGVDLLGPGLGERIAQPALASDAARAFQGSVLPPYVGPWPAELPGGVAGFVADGVLVRAPPGLEPDTAPMAALPGMLPLGVAGAAGSSVVMLLALDDPSDRADRSGGALLRNQHYAVSLAPISDVLAPEAGGGVIHPATAAAVVDRRHPDGTTVFVGPEGIRASVEAPSGTFAEARAGDERATDLLSGGRAGSTVTGAFPFRLPQRLSATKNGNQAYDAALYLATPAGHGYVATWKVTALRDPPPLDASAVGAGFEAEIVGTTSPVATVTVDGRRVGTDPDGTFRVRVSAGLLPRDVRVEASDPFGHARAMVVSVVAPFDYRQLPWIPIVALLTLVVGVLLFLRVPRPSVRRAVPAADDLPFEELEPDD